MSCVFPTRTFHFGFAVVARSELILPDGVVLVMFDERGQPSSVETQLHAFSDELLRQIQTSAQERWPAQRAPNASLALLNMKAAACVLQRAAKHRAESRLLYQAAELLVSDAVAEYEAVGEDKALRAAVLARGLLVDIQKALKTL